jgi:hypothetical protein
MFAEGDGLTIIFTLALSVQLPTVTNTLYEVFVSGLTVIEDVVDPVLHRYVPPPDALSVEELPEHIVSLPVMVAPIFGATVTLTVAESMHPSLAVPITV